jgi:hemerythrin
MADIVKRHITDGVYWIEVEKADLYLCCGCPADVMKHLKKAGVVKTVHGDGFTYETGPNAILLSDTPIQHGQLANLSEFVILHMLYLQGFVVPGNPNYQKYKPLLVGYEKQLKMQIDYVDIGNHGLDSVQQIVEAGVGEVAAAKIFATKLHYANGGIRSMRSMLETRPLEGASVEIKNDVYIERTGLNEFEITYKGEKCDVDLNLEPHQKYAAPYHLPFRRLQPSRFAVSHIGEGNGWDVNRPCMASIIHYEGKTYLIDAGPNILSNLTRAGVGISEIEGIFLTHMHDDHFAGITDMLNVEKKLKLFTTSLIRKTVEKKLQALFHSEFDLLNIAFDGITLQFDTWNNIDGLEVKPSYSPHTVETSIFRFRARHNGDVKSYLHLADTINFKEFDIIIDNNPELFTDDDRQYLKENYLEKVDLKKLDVGGGAIHGHLSDYADDKSTKLVMAHTNQPLEVDDPRFVNADFGDTDQLMTDAGFDYLHTRSIEYLGRYFETLPKTKQTQLADGKMVHFEPDSLIGSPGNGKNIFLILTGLVKFTNDLGMEQLVDAGNFIGNSRKYFLRDYMHQYRSLGHVDCLQFKESYIEQVFTQYNLWNNFKMRVNLANALRDCFLVQYSLSSATFYEIAGEAELLEIPDMQTLGGKLDDFLFILMEGAITVVYDGRYRGQLTRLQHFGGLGLLKKYRKKQHFVLDEPIRAVAIPIDKIMQVPVLLWKLIELEERRYQLSVFERNMY